MKYGKFYMKNGNFVSFLKKTSPVDFGGGGGGENGFRATKIIALHSIGQATGKY